MNLEGMIHVPSGAFQGGAQPFPDEQPHSQLQPHGFHIDVESVANQQFPDRDDRPFAGVR